MTLLEDLTFKATPALEQWRGRAVFPTDLSSAEIRGMSVELRRRSVFSARTTNADYLGEVAEVVDDLLSGKINMATGRLRLMRKLKQLGYDPAIGFPGDMADIPPAERGTLQDLSSEGRLNLMLETNTRMAANYGRMVAGNTEYARFAYPAWQLVRLFLRAVPRGSAESHSVGWEKRWFDAGESVGWEGALKSPMIALKDSPIWQALGNGAGGYEDTLSNPFPPFAWRSGKAWREVNRNDCIRLGLISATGREIPTKSEAPLSPDEKTVNDVFDKLPADLQEEMRRELSTDSERESLRLAHEEFSRREEAAAAERRAGIAEAQAAHQKFLEGLLK